MKVYGPQFQNGYASPQPTRAQSFPSAMDALQAYQVFLNDPNHSNEVPVSACLYIGMPNGNEEKNGYPILPDFIIKPIRDKNGYYKAVMRRY